MRETLSRLLPGKVGAEGSFQQRKAGEQLGAGTSARGCGVLGPPETLQGGLCLASCCPV